MKGYDILHHLFLPLVVLSHCDINKWLWLCWDVIFTMAYVGLQCSYMVMTQYGCVVQFNLLQLYITIEQIDDNNNHSMV